MSQYAKAIFLCLLLAGPSLAQDWQRRVNDLKPLAEGPGAEPKKAIPQLQAIAENDAALMSARLDALWVLGRVYSSLDDRDGFWETYSFAEALVDQIDPPSDRIGHLLRIAHEYCSRHRGAEYSKPDDAIRVLERVIPLAKEANKSFELGKAYQTLGVAYEIKQQYKEAGEAYASSIPCFSKYSELRRSYGAAMDDFVRGGSTEAAAELLEQVAMRLPCVARGDALLAICDKYFREENYEAVVHTARKGVCMIGAKAAGIDVSARLQAKLVKALLAMGKTEEAIAEAKRHYMLCRMPFLADSIEVVGAALSSIDANIDGPLNDFIRNQRTLGFDNQDKSQEGIKDPLADVTLTTPKEYEFLDRLSAELDVTDCRAWGYVCLLRGDASAALAELRSAYSLANGDEVDKAVYDVATALKALDGNVRRASRYLLFQKYGPAGPDRIRDTADDLTDPLEGMEFDLPPEHAEAIKNQILACGNDYAGRRRLGELLLALGKTKEAKVAMFQAYALAPVDASSVRNAAADMARAIKGVDGHIFRANRYLLYQKYGPAGPAGVEDTDDDLTNPLLQEAIEAQIGD